MKRILVVLDHYLPGYKAGGPVWSVANMIEALASEAEFFVVTRDHDLGESQPYSGLKRDEWQDVGRAQVYYASHARRLGDAINDVRPHVVYLNSLFGSLSIRTMMLRRIGKVAAPIVLAPRGELAAGALQFSRWKKIIFLRSGRFLRLYEDILWQATSEEEVGEIESTAPARTSRVALAPPFTQSMDGAAAPRAAKRSGELHLLFASRISQKKNLDGVLRAASRLRIPTTIDLVGPVGDPDYWDVCKRAIDLLPANVQVRYFGAVAHDQLQHALATADVFFLPTHGENHGHVIVEALAAGCPVLISDRTPWRQLASKSAGWDIPLTDEQSFTTTLERVAAMSEEEHRTWREGARAYAAVIERRGEAMTNHRALFALP